MGLAQQLGDALPETATTMELAVQLGGGLPEVAANETLFGSFRTERQ